MNTVQLDVDPRRGMRGAHARQTIKRRADQLTLEREPEETETCVHVTY